MSPPEALRIPGPFANSELVLDCTDAPRDRELIASIYLNAPDGTRYVAYSLVFTYCALKNARFEDGGQSDAPLLWLDNTCLCIPRPYTQAVTDYLLAARQAAANPRTPEPA